MPFVNFTNNKMFPSYKELKRTTDDILRDRTFNSFRIKFIKDDDELSAYNFTCSCPPTEVMHNFLSGKPVRKNKLINFDYKYVRRLGDSFEIAGGFGRKNFISAEFVPFASSLFSFASNFKTKFSENNFRPSIGLVAANRMLNVDLSLDALGTLSYSMVMGSLSSNVGVKGSCMRDSCRVRWRFNSSFNRNAISTEFDFDSDAEYAIRSCRFGGSRYIDKKLSICGVIECENRHIDERLGWEVNYKDTKINSFVSITSRTVSTVFRQKVSEIFDFVVSGKIDYFKKDCKLGISLEWFNKK